MRRVGVLGAGQLGRMLAIAGLPLDIRCQFFDPVAGSPASHLAEQKVADYGDLPALNSFAAGVEVITYEFENVPVEAARLLEQRQPVLPPPLALEKSQDRLVEKSFFRELGIPTPKFVTVNTIKQLTDGLDIIGRPAVLKTRRLGYDGKGQIKIERGAEIEAAWNLLKGAPLILEQHIPFEREFSILAVRNQQGETAFYPLIENHHRNGILRLSLAPAPGVTAELQSEAEACARKLLTRLDYVGVLAIEFFLHGGHLLASEMAPRVHNSGHWSIEGAVTSQFENHMRAVTGLPLGAVDVNGVCAMLNLIGTLPDAARLLAIPGVHLHHYGKEPRPNRKLGHITLLAPHRTALRAIMKIVAETLSADRENDGGWSPLVEELLLHE